MLNIPELFKKHGILPKGVIHVGGHTAEELETYLGMGFETIIFIEADPENFKRMEARVKGSALSLPAGYQPQIILVEGAAGNHDGHATLYRTSSSQSHSLLPLKDHKAVYPQIVEQGYVKVECARLDTLLKRYQIPFSKFNYLHMDVQGYEGQVLEGAPILLRHLDAICSEVNTREMYEGCWLRDQLEEFLDGDSESLGKGGWGHRFAPMEEVVGGDGWGDVFYVRRPLPFIQMAALGRMGRLGNGCFQYVFGKLTALGSLAQVPPWWDGRDVLDFRRPSWSAGEEIFDLPRDLPEVMPVGVIEEDTHLASESLAYNASPSEIRNRSLFGYYQFHTSIYAPFKDQIRGWFKVKHRNTVPSPLAVAHLRTSDDYGTLPQRVPFFKTPIVLVGKWLNGFSEMRTFIATDNNGSIVDVGVLGMERDARKMLLEYAPYGDTKLAEDFAAMVAADYLLVSNSSLSVFAAMLNPKFDGDGWKGHCFRPVPEYDPETKIVKSVRIEEFDPWNCQVLLGK